jgi:hypothetical protein
MIVDGAGAHSDCHQHIISGRVALHLHSGRRALLLAATQSRPQEQLRVEKRWRAGSGSFPRWPSAATEPIVS